MNEQWKRIKLSDVLEEKKERNKDNKINLVLSVTNSNGFVKQADYFEGTVHSEDISKYKLIRKNEFAYNPSRINVGSIDILKKHEIGALSPMYVVFGVDQKRLLPDYFKYYLQTHEFNANVRNNTQGSVRHSLNFKDLLEFKYLLPPIEVQKRIVEILDTVNGVIEKYDVLLQEYQQLVKSQFVEMFGNLNATFKELKDICEFVTVGIANSVTHAYRSQGVVIIRNQNILENKLDDTDLLYIDEEFAKNYKNKVLQENDILAIRTGNPGTACLVPKKYAGSQTFTTLIARLKKSLNNNPVYICHYINSQYGKNFVESNKIGVAQQNLGAKSFGMMLIKIPPIELQNQFADFVKQVDKLKFALEKQKENYVNLKKGLMQQLLTGKIEINI